MTWNELLDKTSTMSESVQFYIDNVTDRLYSATWIAKNLDREVKANQYYYALGSEGLLSLQMYLLLTCADAMGHIVNPDASVGVRFTSFFSYLPADVQESLTKEILVWSATEADLEKEGLFDTTTKTPIIPHERSQIEDPVLRMSKSERFEAVVDYLYVRRNLFTHEAEHPQLGWHPNLSQLQKLRLGSTKVGTLGDMGRIQQVLKPTKAGSIRYWVYFASDDPIAILRHLVVAGLGKIINSHTH